MKMMGRERRDVMGKEENINEEKGINKMKRKGNGSKGRELGAMGRKENEKERKEMAVMGNDRGGNKGKGIEMKGKVDGSEG